MKKIDEVAKKMLLYGMVLFSVSCANHITADWSKATMFVTPHNLGVGASAFNFNDGTGGTHTLTIASTNTSWEITGLPDWLSVDKKSGSGRETVTLTCAENLSPKNGRASMFYVRSTEEDWEYNIPISVTQVRAVEVIDFLGKSPVYFDGGSGNQTFYVSSNVEDWTIEANTDDGSWLTVTKADGKSFTIIVQPNPNNVDRKAYVTLHTRDRQKQLTVVQRPGKIVLTKETMSYSYEGGELQASVTADAPWTVETSESWLEVLPAKGSAGTTDVTVRATANNSFSPRSGSVYFVMADDNKIALPVNQGNITFSLSKDALPFSYTSESKSLSITSNAEWLLSSDTPEWLTLSTTEGNGDAEVSVSAQTNASVYPRTAQLSFRPKLIDTNFDVSVSQAPQVISPDTTAMLFGSKGGSQQFSFEATGEWIVVSDKEWISVVDVSTGKTTGTGNATCRVTVEENKAGFVRGGEVRIIFYENEYVIPVSQQEAISSLSLEILDCESRGGAYEVDIYSTTHWNTSIEDNAGWLTTNPTEGEDSCRFTITVADNPSLSSRTGKVMVSPVEQTPLAVTVNQSPRYLNVNTGSVEFFAKGGTSELITVETDGEYDVKTTNDWLTIEKMGDSGFIINAMENLTANQRTGEVEISLTDLTEGELSRTLMVSQEIHTLSVSADSIVFYPIGGVTEEIVVETDGEYTARSSNDWLKVSLIDANRFTITASENNTRIIRSGEVRVSLVGIVSGNIERIISVTQGCAGEPIDLGLTSGLFWATQNLGASPENQEGDFYAWGETEVKDLYKWNTYKYCNGDMNSLTKYCTSSTYGVVDNLTILEDTDDAAKISWGVNWRMPTYEEWKELKEECTWSWYVGSNWSGYRIKGPNGNEIFLPAAGYCDGKTISWKGIEGRYWSSSLHTESSNKAMRLAFSQSTGVYAASFIDRFYGHSVRPVYSVSIGVSTKTVSFSAIGGTSEVITVQGDEAIDVNPTSSTDAEWLTVNKVSDTSFTITASENMTASARTGSITVSSRTYNGIKKTITVHQAVHALSVSKDNVSFPAIGGTSSVIIVKTDGQYSITTSDDWLTINKTDNATFTITASENTTDEIRNGSVVVSLGETSTSVMKKTIEVSQAYHSLSVDKEKISVSCSSSNTFITVDASGDYTATSDSEWITILNKKTSGFSISVTNNETTSVREGTVTVSLVTGPTIEKTVKIKVIQQIDINSLYNKIELQTVDASGYGYLWSNAPDQTEGRHPEYMLDGDVNTFFHSDWHGQVSDTHFLQVNLGEGKGITDFVLCYTRRMNNNRYRPTEIVIKGSNDGENWTHIRTLTQEADGLPVDANEDSYTSDVITADQAYGYLRFDITKTNNGTIFFTFSEFSIFTPKDNSNPGGIINNGTYYFYNEENNKFLSRGAAWGTQACLDEFGLPFVVSTPEYGITWLSAMDMQNKHIGQTNGTDGGTYVDQTSEGDLVYEYAGSEYIFKNTAAGYLAIEDNENTKPLFGLGVHGTEATALRFKLLSAAEYEKMIADRFDAETYATFNTVGLYNRFEDLLGLFQIDVTDRVQSASLTGSNEGWIWTTKQAGLPGYFRGGSLTTNENGTETWKGCGVLSQTIEGLRPGLYHVTLNGFFRINGLRVGNIDWYQNGYVMSTAYLEANGNKVRIKPIGAEATINEAGDGIYPNWMNESKACFDEGKYLNEVYAHVGEDGKLDISVTQPTWNDDCWLMLGGIKLTYYSTEAE